MTKCAAEVAYAEKMARRYPADRACRVYGMEFVSNIQQKEVGIEEGQQAPDFSLRTLSGEKSSLQDTKGKKYCSIFGQLGVNRAVRKCRRWNSCKKKHADELAVVAVNFTSAEKSEKQVRAFADTYDLTFPILIDKKGLMLTIT